MGIRYLAYLLPFLGLVGNGLWGSPYDYCSQILANGVHDIYDSTHNVKEESLLIAWACSADASSSTSRLTLELIIASLPEGGGFSDVETWQRQRCSSEQRQHGTGDFSHNLVQLVNSNVVDAWKSCVGGQNKGLICFAEDTGTSLTFTIGWNPGPGIPRVLDMEVGLRNVTSALTLPTKLIPGEDTLDLVVSTPDIEAKVVVRATDNSSFRTSCSYLMIPMQKIVTPPTIPDDDEKPVPPPVVRGPYPETFFREYDIGNLYIQVHRVSSGLSNAPQASVKLPDGFVLLSGGAQVNWTSPGNLLTSSYPLSSSEWTASATDYRGASQGTVTVYAIGARMIDGSKIPSNVYDLVIKTSDKKRRPTALAQLLDDFTLVGGGAQVINPVGLKHSSFLLGSYPTANSWTASATDHAHVNPAQVVSYAIGFQTKFLSDIAQVQTTLKEVTSQFLLRVPQGSCSIGQNEVLIGGGARVNWKNLGLLMTSSYPESLSSWGSMAKEHEVHDVGTMTTWCLGLKTPQEVSSQSK